MKRPPAGLEDFAEIIEGDYYYIDKTELIRHLILRGRKVTLFTRPRRFGKSLNLSMLQEFFEIGSDPKLFDGLAVSRDPALIAHHLGKYPVISLSLKNVDGSDFDLAFACFCGVMSDEARRLQVLENSSYLDDFDRQTYRDIVNLGRAVDCRDKNTVRILTQSLFKLTELLKKHYGTRVIVLIDEYDVPLDKAHVHGYYDEMVELLRNMFTASLKTNKNLAFAVLTGCLRISKESIFTGMNNLVVDSITSLRSGEFFGFTEDETRAILSDYGLSDRREEVREWYDGYQFGDTRVYCPWDVINYCADLTSKERTTAVSYWANSSGNDLVQEFVQIAGENTSRELETLVEGRPLIKQINENITYRELTDSVQNLWSVLFSTGYLTGYVRDDGNYVLQIPNREVQQIFERDIVTWFTTRTRQDTESGARFYHAALSGDPRQMEEVLTGLLFDSISIRNTYTRKHLRENFYHSFVAGLLTPYRDIRSNPEAGNGYSDILIQDRRGGTAAILELKYADSDSPRAMEAACQDALRQIERMHYDADVIRSGLFRTVHRYGISFYRKQSCVRIADEAPA